MNDVFDLFDKNNLMCGRIISWSKKSPPGHICVWNANVIIKSSGKVWFGDLNITKEGEILKSIAKDIGETLYVLRESDARFGTETDSIENLISRSIWNTELQIPK